MGKALLSIAHRAVTPTPHGHTYPLSVQVLRMLREDQALLERSPRCADTVVAILTACGASVEGSAGAAGRSRVPAVQPALVQQIMDMGFPRNRVEEALRRVGTHAWAALAYVAFLVM